MEENPPKTRVDPTDGTVYEWVEEKKAWFPMITEDFLAHYHYNYGFVDNTKPMVDNSTEVATKTEEQPEKKDQSEIKPTKTEGWFEIDNTKNNHVYVSGLPKDIDESEFVEFMSKCGIVAMDAEKNQPKIKLYKDSDGNLKGDGLCCYLKHESIELVLSILDGQHIRPNFPVHIEQAQFEQKGAYNPKLKKRRKRKQENKKTQEKLLDWVDRDNTKKLKHLSVVVIKNAFTVAELAEQPQLILEIKSSIRTIGEEFGKVKRVLLFDTNPEGVCSLTFETKEIAEYCQSKLDKKTFRTRTISAFIWDGVTDYKVTTTDVEEKSRLDNWQQYLEK